MTTAVPAVRPVSAPRSLARVAGGAGLPAFCLLAIGAVLFPSSGRDDSYLTYWPAHTLASLGEILNLNGDRVEQSSSLLEVVLLAAAAWLTDLPLALLGPGLSVLGGIACVVSAHRSAVRLGPEFAGAAWLVATATPLVYWSFSGLETSLAALCSLAVVVSHADHLRREGRVMPSVRVWIATALFLAVRPESVFVLAAALTGGAVLSRDRRRGFFGLGLVTLLTFVPLVGFRLAYFGSAFPQPVAAKSFSRITSGSFGAQLSGGLGYVSEQGGTIFMAAFWVGIGVAIATLLRVRTARRFELVASLFCLAYLAFVVTTGGDYMEGARYLVPFVPVALLLAAGFLGRARPDIAKPVLIGLVALQCVGVVVFAQRESTGIPLASWLAEGFALDDDRHVWTEGANRVHRRDLEPGKHLIEIVSRIHERTGQPVTVLSKQMGMVPFHLALHAPGAARFIDAYGLATRDVTSTAFAPLEEAWRRDFYATLFAEPAAIERAFGVARPAVLYDLRTPHPALDENGYRVVYRQRGWVGSPSTHLPGGAVSADYWIAVREDLLPALRPDTAPEAPAVAGRWRSLRAARVDPTLTVEQREMAARLESIGYLSGSVTAPARSGVVGHDADRSAPGLNFFTSGHAPEGVLMDMDGAELHRWRYGFRQAFPDYPAGWSIEGTAFWRRAHLFANGDVLAIFEGHGLIKIDARSQLLWARPLRAHHDFEVTDAGEIYVLTRRARLIPRIDPEQPVLEDSVSVLDANGNEVRRVSLLEALERSRFRALWNPAERLPSAAGTPTGELPFGDLFHTNSLAILDGSLAETLPAFRRGNVLVSLLVPNLIAVLDLDAEEIVWAQRGGFAKQHDPQVVGGDRLLVFDNQGAHPHSRVLELDPARPDEVLWSYAGSDARPFFSATCGAAQRLPNGNTLITESDGGRAFEVTREGRKVWEFYNPHRAGEDGDLIATLFEVVRLPPDFPRDWVRATP